MAERNDGRCIAIRPARPDGPRLRPRDGGEAGRVRPSAVADGRRARRAAESRAHPRVLRERRRTGTALLDRRGRGGRRGSGSPTSRRQLDFFTGVRTPTSPSSPSPARPRASARAGRCSRRVGGLGRAKRLLRPDSQRLRRQSARPRRSTSAGASARDASATSRSLAETPPLAIREARPEDAPELARLSTQLGYPMTRRPTPRGSSELLAGHSDHSLLVAAERRPARGLAAGEPVPHLRVAGHGGDRGARRRRGAPGGRDRRFPRRFRGRLGAGARLPGAPRADERDPRAGAALLRTRGVRPPQATARPRKAPRGVPPTQAT